MRGEVTTMTDDELKEIEARATAASAGEWGLFRDAVGVIEGDDESGRCIEAVFATLPTGHVVNRDANAAFLIRARVDVLRLIAAVRERDAEIARLRALLSPAAIVSRPACATCLRAWDVCVCERTP